MMDEFDRLRSAWTKQSQSAGEAEEARRLWRRAMIRSHAINGAEIALLGSILVYLAVDLVRDPGMTATITVAVIAALLGWSMFKRYRLRMEEIAFPIAERTTVLNRRIAAFRARLVRNSAGLILLVPLFALGFMFGRMRPPEDPAPVEVDGPLRLLETPAGKWIAIGVLAAIAVRLGVSVLRDRRALKQLSEVVADYQAEAALEPQD